MTYNDFPILNSTDYQILSSEFEKQKPKTDRTTSIARISMLLLDCKNSCSSLKTNINIPIKKEITKANTNISAILENLNASTNTNTIKEFNVFTFLNKLSKCLHEFILWFEVETKEYYKNLILKSISSLSVCIENITLAISKSTIKIYKFM